MPLCADLASPRRNRRAYTAPSIRFVLRPAALSKQYDNYSMLVSAVLAVLFVAYTYDIGEWHGQCWVVLRNVIFALVAVACGTAAMMAFQGYPYAPLALILTFVPICASARSLPAAFVQQRTQSRQADRPSCPI